jgi:hypothetical protein
LKRGTLFLSESTKDETAANENCGINARWQFAKYSLAHADLQKKQAVGNFFLPARS